MAAEFRDELRRAAIVVELVGLDLREHFYRYTQTHEDQGELIARSERELTTGLVQKLPAFEIQTASGRFGKEGSDLSCVVSFLDSPTNYMIGKPMFGSSVALCREGQPVAAFTFLPFMDKQGRFYSAFGETEAFIGFGMHPIEVALSPRQGAEMCISIPLNPEVAEQTLALRSNAPTGVHFQETGSTVADLSLLASGFIQAAIVLDAPRTDVLGGAFIARKAGAQFVGLDGRAVDLSGETVSGITAHPALIPMMNKWVRRALETGLDPERIELTAG